MKLYDFDLVKQIIKQFNDLGMLHEATLGMQEDWVFSAEQIWFNGKYIKEFPDNWKERQDEYEAQRWDELSEKHQSLTELFDDYDDVLVAGITGSAWATPVIEILLDDSQTFVFDCSRGEFTNDVLDRVNKAVLVAKHNIEESDTRSLEDVQEFKADTSCEKES